MEKEKAQDQIHSKDDDIINEEENLKEGSGTEQKNTDEKSPEDKITKLEEKIVRQFAEMENQRRRYEKEKDDAFEYGGFSFAKETLNLIDNLERSRAAIESDESLKNSEGFDKGYVY